MKFFFSPCQYWIGFKYCRSDHSYNSTTEVSNTVEKKWLKFELTNQDPAGGRNLIGLSGRRDKYILQLNIYNSRKPFFEIEINLANNFVVKLNLEQ